MEKEHIILFIAFLLQISYLYASIGTKDPARKKIYLLISNFWLGMIMLIGLVI